MIAPHFDLAEHALFRAARAVCALPHSLQVALAGGPIELDGQTLEPELIALMRISERLGRQRATSIARLRADQNRSARIAGGPVDEGVVAHDRIIDGASGSLLARHYASAEPDAPLLVFFHGGGFVFGDLDSHDAPCRVLCRHGGVSVLAVAYRLAPEHPFPAAVDDALASFRWAVAHASELGIDARRVGVGGDSAGANLAAVTSLVAAHDGGPAPAAQLLVYPAIDRRSPWPSLELFADGFYLTHDAIKWFNAQYLPAALRGAAKPDPRHNPLAADDLSGLAPSLVVTAGFDPLRDEGEAYAAALAAAGNVVARRRFRGLVHGFFNMVGVSPVCREAVIEIAGATRVLFAARP